MTDKFSDTNAIHFIIKVNKKGECVFKNVNRKFADELGVEKHYIYGLCVGCVLKNEIGSKIIAICQDVFDSGNHNDTKVIIDNKFGSRYIVQVSQTERKAHSCLVYFSGRKLSKNDKENTLNLVINTLEISHYYDICGTSRNAVFVLDIDEKKEFYVRYINPAFEKLTNTKLGNLYGKSVKEIQSSGIHDEFYRQLKKCIQTKRRVEFMHDSGHSFIVIRLSPKIKGNKAVKIFGACTDVTEHVLERKKLESANKRLIYYENILREQLEFEALISKFSRAFIEAGQKGFKTCLNNMVRQIGETIKASGAFLIQYETDDGKEAEKYSWETNCEKIFSKILLAAVHGSYICPMPKKLLIINDVENNISLDNDLKKALKNDGIKSILGIPILKDAEIWGMIYLVQTNKVRMWTTAEVGMIKIAAQTIMSAYQRTAAEKQLEKSNRVLIEYDESLQDLLAVEETIAKVSKQFISVGIRGFDDCVYSMLEEIGELAGLDLIYLFLLDDKDKIFRNDYIWGAKGILESKLKKHIEFSESILSEREKKQNVVIDNTMVDINDYPNLNKGLLGDGIKSFLKVPIKKGNDIIGYLALHKIIGYHKWTKADIKIGKVFCEVFAGAYLRKQDEQELAKANEKLAEFEKEAKKQKDIFHNVTEFIKYFIDANEDDFFENVKAMCQEIAAIMNLDKICLFKYTRDYLYNYMVFDWNSQVVASYNNINTIKRVGRNSDHIMTSDAVENIEEGQKIGFACSHKNNYLGWKINSALGITVKHNGKVWGFLQIGAQEKGYEWEKAEIEKIKFFSEVWVRAYMRIFPDGLSCEIGKIRINGKVPEWEAENEELA